MVGAFLICVTYALAGLAYAPGADGLMALVFIAASASPLLLAGRATLHLPAVRHPTPSIVLYSLLWALGMLNLAVIAIGLGRSPLELLEPESFVLAAAEATARRYTEESGSGNPLLLATSLLLLYWVGATADRVWRLFQVLAFVPLLLYTLLSTEKWPMFLAGAFYISGVFAGFGQRDALRRTARVAVVFGAFGFGLAGVALVMRGFDGDLLELPAQLLHYVLAPFPALGHWLMGPASDSCCGLGLYTFIGAANQLGLTQREAGVFADNFTIYGEETNIYSAWRYLVQDFSVIGPALINLVLALTCLRCLDRDLAPVARGIQGFVVLAATLSLAVTPFVHNSVALATALAIGFSAAVAAWPGLRLRPAQPHPA